VVVTGNYDLTVRRVSRALEGCDAWLVVAPSSGINVWCAAAGGHLGTHQVVTALKTSGVEQVVRHRRAILPQLCATGVRAREVSRRCGWHTRFGPVAAEDLPRYLASGGDKTEAMRRVRFGPRERLEMAAAWGVPAAVVAGGLALLVHAPFAAPLALLALLLAVAVFFVFDRAPAPQPLWFGGAAALVAVGATALAGGGAAALGTALLATLLLFVVLTFDYAGSTPVRGGSHFEERVWRVVLDPERCEGVYSCWEVCPEACFEKPPPEARAAGERVVRVPNAERCVRCGACVVQCPLDALAFEDAEGTRVEPEVLRRFKLNLLGKRSVDAGTSS
jgi:NAD-dependent dihydropyrimidine dehydrogenase PreA subunit